MIDNMDIIKMLEGIINMDEYRIVTKKLGVRFDGYEIDDTDGIEIILTWAGDEQERYNIEDLKNKITDIIDNHKYAESFENLRYFQ